MLRTLLWYLYAVLGAIVSIPLALIYYPFHKLIKNHKFVQWAAEFFLPPLYKIGGIKFEKSGMENLPEGPALYVGNHQGFYDVLLVMTELGKAKPTIAKIEASRIPIVGLWLSYLDCIFIDRGNLRQSLQCLTRAEEMLKAGESIVVFPEGTRSRGPKMGSFKNGTFRCALKAGVPIVPFVIDGSYHGKEETGLIRPANIKLSVLPPVETAGRDAHKTKEMAEEIEGLIRAELERLRNQQ